MGRPARPLHDPGNHRAIERGFVRQAACRSLTKPAKPAGDQEQPGTLTPPQGARSDRCHGEGKLMAITPTYPGVYIEELQSLARPIAGVATSVAAFVGYTARGIDNRAELLLSFSDYERSFGGIESDSELSYAVQQFFANGGSQAYAVRVPRTGARGARVTFANLRFTALSSGAWANGQLLVDVDQNGIDHSAD